MELVNQIKEKFNKTPSDIDGLRTLLSMRKFSEEELAEIAVDFTDDCFCEYQDALNSKISEITLENMNSNYILEAIALLLEFGLDPNTNVKEENVMWNTMWIEAPNIAASVLKLLLENGGNPNHYIPSEGETLFEYIGFKVSYDEYTHEYFHTVQCWLVLMAYGACWSDGEIPIKMHGKNTVDIFKEFEKYDYEIEPLPQKPGKYGCWRMHIYNIETKEEVAIY